MAVNSEQQLDRLIEVIREVKPSLANRPIGLEDSLVEHLGLDSLDITQLARKVRRIFGNGFDPQGWVTLGRQHRYSVQSLLNAAAGLPGAGIPASETEQVSPPAGPQRRSASGQ